MNSGTVNEQSKPSNRIDVDPNRLYARRKVPPKIAGLRLMVFVVARRQGGGSCHYGLPGAGYTKLQSIQRP
jgi:hypothetical protein